MEARRMGFDISSSRLLHMAFLADSGTCQMTSRGGLYVSGRPFGLDSTITLCVGTEAFAPVLTCKQVYGKALRHEWFYCVGVAVIALTGHWGSRWFLSSLLLGVANVSSLSVGLAESAALGMTVWTVRMGTKSLWQPLGWDKEAKRPVASADCVGRPTTHSGLALPQLKTKWSLSREKERWWWNVVYCGWWSMGDHAVAVIVVMYSVYTIKYVLTSSYNCWHLQH